MKYIFTDCFDTLIVRREHPYQVVKRWSQCVSRLYPSVNSDMLYSDRMLLIKQIKSDIEGIYTVYDIIAEKYIQQGLIKNKRAFVQDLLMLELKCEKSTISINKKVHSFLKDKKKSGSYIYCITDFHFSSMHMKEILDFLGLDFLDGVFSSASFGQTKHDGGLYYEVLNILQLQPAECLMIGDNKVSDIQKAKEAGLKTKYFSNSFHKNILRVKYRLNINSAAVSLIGKELWKQSDSYIEFSLVFYTFCVRLYSEVSKRGGKRITFLAREGWLLKKCFETYQRFCIPVNKRLETVYLKCSRRAIHSVQQDKCLPGFFKAISVLNYFLSIGFTEEEAEQLSKSLEIEKPEEVIEDFGTSIISKYIWDKLGDVINKRIEENKAAFEKYVHGLSNGDKLILVDVGWIGRMQQGIDCLFTDIKTTGFYVGVYQNLFEKPFVERHGLVFNKTEKGKESAFFHVFRSNTQVYEQLLAAPHGSACFYRLDEKGMPVVQEKWEREEELLYKEVIADVQKKVMKEFENLCTYLFVGIEESCYTPNSYNKALALIMLRSALVQSKERLVFMQRLIQGFSQNFQQQTIGMKFNAGDIQEKYINLVFHPDRFVRYVSKLGVVLDKKGMNRIGRFLMKLYYYWVRALLRI